jgi:hypothetical protein
MLEEIIEHDCHSVDNREIDHVMIDLDLDVDETTAENQASDEDQSKRDTRRGNHIRKLNPAHLESVEGRNMIFSRLDMIFTQLGIAGNGDAINHLIGDYNEYHANTMKATITDRFTQLRVSLRMSEDEFKAYTLEHLGIVGVESDGLQSAKPVNTRKSKTVAGKSIE